MYIIEKRPGDQIKLGRKGEYNARRIALDLSAWQTRYGDNGTVQLLYQRPGDATPYPVALTREGHLVLWTVAAADTANSGNSGRAELRYYIGDALVKSAISQVVVEPSLGEPGDAPNEEQQSWLDQAVQAGSTAQTSAAQAAASAQSAQSAADTATNSAQSAQNSAAQVANNAQSVQTSAETASTSASAAEASAQSSAAHAQTAQSAANQATNSANAAEASAQSSAAHAQTAQGAASQASTSANAAEASAQSFAAHAQTAQSAASQASTSANAAEASAQSSAASAVTAQNAATQAIDSVSAAEASAQSSAASAVTAQNAANQATNSANAAETSAQSAQTAAESAAASASAAEQASTALDTLVDDHIVTPDTLWSSEKIISYLCETFMQDYISADVTHGGGILSFDPVPNSTLRVTVDIDANQKYQNTPAPNNSNPLQGWSSVSLTLTAGTNTASYDFDLGGTFYGGVLDCNTGLFTVKRKVQFFDGTEDWRTCSVDSVWHPILAINGISPNPNRKNRYTEKCSHYAFCKGTKLDGGSTGICTTGDGIEIYDPSYTQEDPTAWKNWLVSLNANGDPFHVVVNLNEPYTIQLEPAQIIAFAGTNSMRCSIGGFSVSCKQDFRYELKQIKEAIKALQS